jgi:hypothetical protein
MAPKRVVLDAYVVETLMPDLVGHDRSPAAYLLYLYLWLETESGTRACAASYQTLAANTGLSKRTVQVAIAHLLARGLVAVKRAYATALPEYRVRKPWARRAGQQSV